MGGRPAEGRRTLLQSPQQQHVGGRKAHTKYLIRPDQPKPRPRVAAHNRSTTPKVPTIIHNTRIEDQPSPNIGTKTILNKPYPSDDLATTIQQHQAIGPTNPGNPPAKGPPETTPSNLVPRDRDQTPAERHTRPRVAHVKEAKTSDRDNQEVKGQQLSPKNPVGPKSGRQGHREGGQGTHQTIRGPHIQKGSEGVKTLF